MKTLVRIALLVAVSVNCNAQYKDAGQFVRPDNSKYVVIECYPLPNHVSGRTDEQKALDASLRPDRPNTLTLTRIEAMRMPTTDIRDLQALAPGIYQRRRGEDAVPVGGRPGEIQYVVDGMRIDPGDGRPSYRHQGQRNFR